MKDKTGTFPFLCPDNIHPEAKDSYLMKDPTHALCWVEVKTRFGPDGKRSNGLISIYSTSLAASAQDVK